MPRILAQKEGLFIALLLLSAMGILMLGSNLGDSLTMDEIAHLPSGYSYLTKKDMRLNPEHPPLVKDIAAIPLLFLNITFPHDIDAWKDDVNGQWDFGFNFFYDHGNPADKMVFWGRIPMILLTIFLGFFLFKWIRELFGHRIALFALFLFSFSPTFLAHGRLVTTDVAATLGAVMAFYYFIKFLQKPVWKNVLLAGATLGLAQLLKFSLILLFPAFSILLVIWIFATASKRKKELLQYCGDYIFKSAIIFGIFIVAIFPVYQYHVYNYPIDKQIKDINGNLTRHQFKWLAPSLASMADKPILRAYAQYLLGVGMVFNRTTSGNTTYFAGEVSNKGWRRYFPTVYAIKEPIPFHLFSLAALAFGIEQTIKKRWWKKSRLFLSSHFVETSAFIWLAIYWLTSLATPLNIGVRHLTPTFPFVILLCSSALFSALKTFKLPSFQKIIVTAVIVLCAWQAVSVFRVYPYFLAYFNELAGGPNNGHKITIDSNLDWGQDMRRLARFVQKNNIEKIKVAYFGGGKPEYYLKDRFEPFRWKEPQMGWIAISATLLMNGIGEPVRGFDQPTGFFKWLKPYTPVAKIGYSIFVYHITE